MRFFLSGSIKRNKHLFYITVFLLIFEGIFWVFNWFYYKAVFGLSFSRLTEFFFGLPEYPEKIELSSLFQEIHIFFFVNFFAYFVLAAVLNLFHNPIKRFLIISTFILLTLEVLSNFLIYFTGSLVFIKLLFFYMYQLSFFLMLIFTFHGLISEEEKTDFNFLRTLIIIFAIFGILFTFLNFFLFKEKIGFSTQSIKEYYLGNPDKFLRPKSFEGLLKVFYPHILSISIFYFTLSHFLLFISLKFKIFIMLSLIVLPIIETSSGFFISFFHENFIYLKLFSFYVSSLLTVITSFILIKENLFCSFNRFK
ncbi:MAG TPA: hypothetical protein EYP32_06925 [Aquificaceae bacterium]|nr:hypothetical protein [Aquificaceae bacterium]